MTKTIGLVLGKFMPPHNGHMALCRFAAAWVDELVVVVGTQPSEENIMPGTLRYDWMRRLLPTAHVLHLQEELPQRPDDHPDFWGVWRAALARVLPTDLRPDFVFASEPYVVPLAALWGARPVAYDVHRRLIPISATQIRHDPWAQPWALPSLVRAHFVKRFCLMGPESSGKSVLARSLARHYGTVCVPEFAEDDIKLNGWPTSPEALIPFVRGQRAAAQVAVEEAFRLMLEDTDPLTTLLWSRFLFEGRVVDEVQQAADAATTAFYLVPTPGPRWVADGHRLAGAVDPTAFFKATCSLLEARGRPYAVLEEGDWETREKQAISYIDQRL
jgi:NadR type nicotinamide-nucleotide adenylyltransferase